jgi:AcrR family transcriptional regulator
VTEPLESNSRRRLTRDEARQLTRERLLDAASEVFKRLGYNGASLDAVAEAAGYTKGAVYSNFATKADLFMALLERYVAREGAAQGARLESGTLEDFIDELDKTLEHQTRSDPEWVLLQLEFFLAAARDPVVRERYLESAEETRVATGKILDAKMKEIGLKPPFKGEELGVLLNALGTGLALGFYLEPEAMDPKLFVRAVRVLSGLDPSQPGGLQFRVALKPRRRPDTPT